MLTATILLMAIAVVAVLVGGLAWSGRSRARTHPIASGGNDVSWSPAVYSGGGDVSGGDSGCDSGGGSDGGGGGCDGGGGGSD